jgi:hypothetical protein
VENWLANFYGSLEPYQNALMERPVETPFGTIMNALGLNRERVTNALSQPFFSIGPRPEGAAERLRNTAEFAAGMLPYEIIPRNLTMNALTTTPGMGKMTLMKQERPAGYIPTKATPMPEGGKLISGKTPESVENVFDGGVDLAKSLSDQEVRNLTTAILDFRFRDAYRPYNPKDGAILNYLKERLINVYGVKKLSEVEVLKASSIYDRVINFNDPLDISTSLKKDRISKTYEKDAGKILDNLIDEIQGHIGPQENFSLKGKGTKIFSADGNSITAIHLESGTEITIPWEDKSKLWNLRQENFEKYREVKSKTIQSILASGEPKQLPNPLTPPSGGGQ